MDRGITPLVCDTETSAPFSESETKDALSCLTDAIISLESARRAAEIKAVDRTKYARCALKKLRELQISSSASSRQVAAEHEARIRSIAKQHSIEVARLEEEVERVHLSDLSRATEVALDESAVMPWSVDRAPSPKGADRSLLSGTEDVAVQATPQRVGAVHVGVQTIRVAAGLPAHLFSSDYNSGDVPPSQETPKRRSAVNHAAESLPVPSASAASTWGRNMSGASSPPPPPHASASPSASRVAMVALQQKEIDELRSAMAALSLQHGSHKAAWERELFHYKAIAKDAEQRLRQSHVQLQQAALQYQQLSEAFVAHRQQPVVIRDTSTPAAVKQECSRRFADVQSRQRSVACMTDKIATDVEIVEVPLLAFSTRVAGRSGFSADDESHRQLESLQTLVEALQAEKAQAHRAYSELLLRAEAAAEAAALRERQLLEELAQTPSVHASRTEWVRERASLVASCDSLRKDIVQNFHERQQLEAELSATSAKLAATVKTNREVAESVARLHAEVSRLTMDRDALTSKCATQAAAEEKQRTAIVALQEALAAKTKETQSLQRDLEVEMESARTNAALRASREAQLQAEICKLQDSIRATAEGAELVDYRRFRNVVSGAVYDDLRSQLDDYQQQEAWIREALIGFVQCRRAPSGMPDSGEAVDKAPTDPQVLDLLAGILSRVNRR